MIKVPHHLVYSVVAALYAGACFGLDKTLVAGLLAAGYTLLALASEH